MLSGLRGWLRQGGLEKTLFVASLCAAAFAYGVATLQWKLFPYPVVHKAILAVDAWRKVGDDKYPSQIEAWEAGGLNTPVRTLSPRAGHENLMVQGGFYSRMDLCPRFGCLAWIMTREGKALHVWPAPDPKGFFREARAFSGAVKPINFYVIGAALGADGSLVTTFHGHDMFPYQVGIAKFDRNGRLLWKRFDNSHHWPAVDAAGQVYAPSVNAVKDAEPKFAGTQVPSRCLAGTTWLEGVRVLGPDGGVRREFWLRDLIARSDYPGLAYAIRNRCDPHHVNSVDLVNAAAARRLGLDPGDLLISVREQSVLMILDKDTGDIRRLIPARAAAQHSAKFLPDGAILVFDNLGGQRALGGSRVLWIDPATGASRTVFPHGGEGALLPFYSEQSGALAVSPDGARVMAASSKQGRTVEIDVKTGEPLWVMESVMDFAPYLKARGIRQKLTFARTTANGVQYVADLDFLKRPAPAP